eukprot:snap_masked-scaffold_28-processed-gene-2.38-mRNA-1 protein AED:1.00 eAED:1.00 QI:0/0/0/0/1/1/2/0/63
MRLRRNSETIVNFNPQAKNPGIELLSSLTQTKLQFTICLVQINTSLQLHTQSNKIKVLCYRIP